MQNSSAVGGDGAVAEGGVRLLGEGGGGALLGEREESGEKATARDSRLVGLGVKTQPQSGHSKHWWHLHVDGGGILG